MDPIDPESDLMLASHPIEIIRHLERIVVEVARSRSAALYIEVVADAYDQGAGHRAGNIDAERRRIRNVAAGAAKDSHAVGREVERVNHRAIQRVRISDHGRLVARELARLARRQKVDAVKYRRIAEIGDEITPEHGVS